MLIFWSRSGLYFLSFLSSCKSQEQEKIKLQLRKIAKRIWLPLHGYVNMGKLPALVCTYNKDSQIFQHHKHSLISSLYLLLIYHLPFSRWCTGCLHADCHQRQAVLWTGNYPFVYVFLRNYTWRKVVEAASGGEVQYRKIHSLQSKNVSSSCVPSKKIRLFLVFRRYPLEQYNYSEDTSSLYEMWYPALRATLEKLIRVAIVCLFQFTQLCDWQKLPKQNPIKYNFDSHKTSLSLL